jgi:cobalt-zinc-cadmium efflux system outer membrane protein
VSSACSPATWLWASPIDLNLARAAAARSIRRLELARGAYLEARSSLAQTAGLDPTAPPEPAGGLEAGAAELPPLTELVRSALENREDLAAFQREEEAARARVGLEQALARPNLVARAFRNREADTDDITGASISVGVPLFNRNQGGIAEARAAADRAAAETAATRLAVEREVTSLLAAYRAASAAAEALGSQVIGNLQENLGLLQRSFEEGKIGRSELLLFRRELVDSQREHLEAIATASQARIRLDLAAGRLPLPLLSNRSSQP